MTARAFAVVALALVGCSSSNDAGTAIAIDPKALYEQNCARCHGVDGKGDANLRQAMPTLRDLTDPAVKAQPTDALERVIMAGRNQMPAFGGQLSAPKIQAVVGYVKRLGTTK